MIKLKDNKINDRLTRTVEADIAEPFVVGGRFSTSHRFYADRIRLVFVRNNDEPWQLYDAVVSGDRCLKDGRRGIENKSANYPSYAASRRPDWLNEIIDFFTPEA